MGIILKKNLKTFLEFHLTFTITASQLFMSNTGMKGPQQRSVKV